NTVWQRAGRAGRPGLDLQGEVVLFAATFDRQAKLYEQGAFEPIRSGLSEPQSLAEQVIVEVAGGLARTPGQLQRVFARSLAAYQERLPDVGKTIAEMIQAGLLKEVIEAEEGNERQHSRMYLAATRLGRIASRHLLAPATVLTFKRFFEI